jgi:hypothetical protein
MSEYIQGTIMLPHEVIAAIKAERLTRGRAGIGWLGYVEVADRLTEY